MLGFNSKDDRRWGNKLDCVIAHLFVECGILGKVLVLCGKPSEKNCSRRMYVIVWIIDGSGRMWRARALDADEDVVTGIRLLFVIFHVWRERGDK